MNLLLLMVNVGKCTVRPMDPMGNGILTQLTNYPNNYMSIFATKQSTKMQQQFLNSWLHSRRKQRLDTLKIMGSWFSKRNVQASMIRGSGVSFRLFSGV